MFCLSWVEARNLIAMVAVMASGFQGREPGLQVMQMSTHHVSVGRSLLLVFFGASFGAPQCGQAAALSLICFPHSMQAITAMIPPVLSRVRCGRLRIRLQAAIVLDARGNLLESLSKLGLIGAPNRAVGQPG